MASSSTSSSPKSFKYDVFLSFRGEDTRHTFVDHLNEALKQKSIRTYLDEEKIQKGRRISDDLFTSIEESRFYIIVFSKTYASSSWCLDELAKIIECQKMTEHIAYPVFYHVEPTEVRNQSGVVRKALARHENNEAAGKWRDALEDASHLAGWEYKDNIGETNFIKQIVHRISLELRSTDFFVDERLIGMETRINEIVTSLETSYDDIVRMFGITGMGGAGKTTLARAVYDKISFLFEGKSFVENVREVSNSLLGLKILQHKVLSDVLNDQSINVSDVSDGKAKIRKSMCCRKVLIVLDDVDHLKQLEALAGDCSWFKPGSRIIITTRDKQLLLAHRVWFKQVMYDDVTLLSENEAISLLSRYAFGEKTPAQGYEELSIQVTRYASGLPLTITVLGSNLCGKDECMWRDVIEELKEIPLEETQKQLELSYNGLKDQHKEIFLDVACFMKGWRKDDAIRALESYRSSATDGLRVLELKSLITISFSDIDGEPRLGMHDHIEEMGRNIVRRPYHDKPHTHSRLWKDEEIEEILAKDLGTEATCIKVKMKSSSLIYMKGFRKMENLRFLHLSRQTNVELDVFPPQIKFEDEVSQYFPDTLRYFFWERYPFHCLPNTFRAKNLVRLEMPGYGRGQLWESGRREVLYKLKFLVLKSSSLRTLNLGVTPNLEMLSLEYCSYLKELHMPEKLQKLKYLDLAGSSLKSFDLGKTPNLVTLDLRGCSHLRELHMANECPKLKSLKIGFGYFKFDEFEKFEDRPNLRTIDLRRSLNIKELRVDLCDDDSKSNVHNLLKFHMPNELQELKYLFLKHPTLRTVYLGRTSNQPSSLEGRDESEDNHMALKCPSLQSLDLRCSKLKILDLQMNPSLENVCLRCPDLIHTSGWASELKSLKIFGSKNLETLDLLKAVNLEVLELEGCRDFMKLDMPPIQSKLKSLCITYSKLSTFDLGQAMNLEKIHLDCCSDLVNVHVHGRYPNLKDVFLNDLPKLRTLDLLQAVNLEALKLKGCHDFMKLDMPAIQSKLKSLNITFSKLSAFDLGQALNLETLHIERCSDLVNVHMHGRYPKLRDVFLNNLPKLRTLDLMQAMNLEVL